MHAKRPTNACKEPYFFGDRQIDTRTHRQEQRCRDTEGHRDGKSKYSRTKKKLVYWQHNAQRIKQKRGQNGDEVGAGGVREGRRHVEGGGGGRGGQRQK